MKNEIGLFIIILILTNLKCVLVFDKTNKDRTSPPPEYMFISKKNIKEIKTVDTTYVKTNGLEVIMIKCNEISDSIVVPDIFPYYRSMIFYLKSFPCGDCPTGFIDVRSTPDTLIYTFNITDSCSVECSPYHLFVEGYFARNKLIRWYKGDFSKGDYRNAP